MNEIKHFSLLTIGKNKRNEKRNKTKDPKFYQMKLNFSE